MDEVTRTNGGSVTYAESVDMRTDRDILLAILDSQMRVEEAVNAALEKIGPLAEKIATKGILGLLG